MTNQMKGRIQVLSNLYDRKHQVKFETAALVIKNHVFIYFFIFYLFFIYLFFYFFMITTIFVNHI